jgi:hypothetical protein
MMTRFKLRQMMLSIMQINPKITTQMMIWTAARFLLFLASFNNVSWICTKQISFACLYSYQYIIPLFDSQIVFQWYNNFCFFSKSLIFLFACILSCIPPFCRNGNSKLPFLPNWTNCRNGNSRHFFLSK